MKWFTFMSTETTVDVTKVFSKDGSILSSLKQENLLILWTTFMT